MLLEGLQTKQALDALQKACASQGPSTASSGSRQKTVWENPPSKNCEALKWLLCKPHDNGSAENSQCKICQENWLLHEDKCFWASKEKQNWNKSQEDCTAKKSRIAVIQRQEELDFIQSITEGAQLLWIGLTATSPAGWIWIDGSPFNSTLLQVTGTVQANSCGMLKGNKVISESCSAVTKWICETEALLV
ncbi:killer cell lectin-like receptor subfamily B member 1C [Eublepharis macularius]|uniref:Killer cell lectin-like receptor subfamily B member 1C n=1 Tax=Eublepharis macularius TaxID=481883 RepID=A0AA97J6K8_EUBMA|nr:killer cell lectin-like receptor subfamily B member 1C [Eublepharis macularius]